MENTTTNKTIDFNSLYLDLQCATWQLENPTDNYEVNAAINSIMERMNELQDDPRYAHHATTVLKSVKKRLNGEIPLTELASHVKMLTELIGYGEGYLPAPTAASETLKKVQDKAKEAYAKAAAAVPEDLPQRLKDGAVEAYEQVSAVIPDGAKEKGRQLMGGVRDFIKNHLTDGDGSDGGNE